MVDIENLESKDHPRMDTVSPMNLSNPRDQLPNEKVDDKESWIVKFEENDTDNPKNFKTSYKAFLTFQMSMLALSGSLGSSIVSPAQSEIESQLNVGSEVATLTLSLFVLGKLSWSTWASILYHVMSYV
jgi:hypothetical protein